MNAAEPLPTEHPDLATWTAVCPLEDIVPNTGVAALVDNTQVAVFRLGASDTVLAIDNHDPQSGANVLSRGLIGSIGDRVVVASPIYKQHFDLRTGECLEDAETPVRAHEIRIEDGIVWVRLR